MQHPLKQTEMEKKITKKELQARKKEQMELERELIEQSHRFVFGNKHRISRAVNPAHESAGK